MKEINIQEIGTTDDVLEVYGMAIKYKYTCNNCKLIFTSRFKEPLCKCCGSKDMKEENLIDK